MPKGTLMVISGPSGVGKDTVLAELLKREPDLLKSVSATTRAMRENETDGVDYIFVTREQFLADIEARNMLEYAEYTGNLYGTPKGWVENKLNEGANCILKIEVQGAKQVKTLFPDCLSIFILPPGIDELKRRLQHRATEDEEQLKKRLDTALFELTCVFDYDYAVVNDNLEEAIEEIRCIILANSRRVSNQTDKINNILNKGEPTC